MAKRVTRRASRPSPRKASRRKKAPARKASVKRPIKKAQQKKAPRKKAAPKRTAVSRRAPKRLAKVPPHAPARKAPRLDRTRRTLDEVVASPPSSWNMDRHGSAARTGRSEQAGNIARHGSMSSVTGGDVDVDIETAYFSGDEAPGGDNPSPDQEVVDDIGKALGIQYDDSEELKGSDKVTERDKHRWEMDPASSEDYRDRK